MKPNNLHTENAALGCGNEGISQTFRISKDKIGFNWKKFALFTLLTFGILQKIDASTFTSKNTGGTWNNAGTWTKTNSTNSNTFPDVGDIVIISTNSNDSVTIPSGSFSCASLQVANSNGNKDGKLVFSTSTSILNVSGNVQLGDNSSSNNRIGSIYMTNGGTLKIGGTFTAPNFGGFVPGTGTIEYTGTNQTVLDLTAYTGGAANAYNNLTLSGSGTKTMTGVTATGTITLTGTSAASALPTSIPNLVINNAGGVSLPNNTTITNSLTFTNGNLSLAGNTLTMASGATITGASSSKYIVTNGANARLVINNLSASSTTLFPIGTSTLYLPVSLKPDASGTNFSVRVFKGATKNATENSTPVSNKSSIVDAVWIVNNTTATNTSAAMTLQWDATLQGSSFNINQVGASHYNTTTTSWDPATTPISTNGSNSITASVSNFTAFGIGPIGTPLPIILKNFTGTPVKNTAQLNWETANDDAREFILEKSTDGKNFATVTTIASNLTRQYAYTDPIQAGINNYYRLKMPEIDGSYTYSSVVSIKTDKMADPVVTVYPNPATSWLELSHSLLTTTAKAEITDLQGRIIISQNIESNTAHTKINISNLPQGYFMVRIKGDALNFSQAFLHQ